MCTYNAKLQKKGETPKGSISADTKEHSFNNLLLDEEMTSVAP